MPRRKTKEINWKLYIQCNKCWEFKEANNEYFDKNHLWYLWLQWACKVCVRERQKEYVINNKNIVYENRRKRYENNKDKYKKYTKKWIENNKEKFLSKCREYRLKNKIKYDNYMKEYRDKYRKELREKRIERDNNKWYVAIHNKTNKLIRKLWIKPNTCPICWERKTIYSHHPNYGIRNEVVFCCQSCHWKIHSWAIERPTTINLLDYNKQ